MKIPFAVQPRAGRRFDVVGLGLNSIDLVGVVREYPERNSKDRLEQFARVPGGQIATAMSVCARLGWQSAYIGNFGDDEFGRIGRESLEAEGVDLSGVRIVPGATSQFAIVLVEATSGERTVLWHRHPLLAMGAADVPGDLVAAGRLLAVDCHETGAAAEAARLARAAAVVTIVDVEKVRPGIDELLRNIDAVIAAESFPTAYTGHEDTGRALEALQGEFGAPLVCVTLGEGGSLARCGGREIRTPAFSVSCVDSTGAGDAFRGGFAAACLRNPEGSVEDVLSYANAVAALNCRGMGARGGMPRPAEVEELVYSRPHTP